MSLQSKQQSDSLIIEAYVQQIIYSQCRSFYPEDIRNLIVSYYHNPSYFQKAGHLCTINRTQNILTCEYSWIHETAKRFLIEFIPWINRFLLFGLLCTIATITISYLWPSMELTEYKFLWSWFAFTIFMTYIPGQNVKIDIFNLRLMSTSYNCCYLSNIMPSHPCPDINIDNELKEEWKYRIKTLEFNEDVSYIYIGLVSQQDIDDSHLNGLSRIDRDYIRYGITIHDFITVGEVLRFIYRPNHPKSQLWIVLEDSASAWSIEVDKDPGMNYRLYVCIGFKYTLKPWCPKKTVKFELL